MIELLQGMVRKDAVDHYARSLVDPSGIFAY